MAIKQLWKIKTELGVDVEINDAYIKVARIFGDKNQMTADVEISSEGKLKQRKTFGFEYTLSGSNPFQQAYFYLKTLPEFADATDC